MLRLTDWKFPTSRNALGVANSGMAIDQNRRRYSDNQFCMAVTKNRNCYGLLAAFEKFRTSFGRTWYGPLLHQPWPRLAEHALEMGRHHLAVTIRKDRRLFAESTATAIGRLSLANPANLRRPWGRRGGEKFTRRQVPGLRIAFGIESRYSTAPDFFGSAGKNHSRNAEINPLTHRHPRQRVVP